MGNPERISEISISFRRTGNNLSAVTGTSMVFDDPYTTGQQAFRDALETQIFSHRPKFIVVWDHSNDARMYSSQRLAQIGRYPIRERDEELNEISYEAEQGYKVAVGTLTFRR